MNKQFLLIFDNFQQLLSTISNQKIVHVFFDESIDNFYQQKLIDKLSEKVKIIKTVIAPCFATEKLASSLIFKGEDFAIAVGKLHLQSLVKYYAYANNIDYGIIPVHEIAEYSFCKYGFLKDDKFCFYLCAKPAFAFFYRDFFTDDDIFKLEKILTYKNIVLYEKEFEKLILNQNSYNLTNIVNSVNICDGSYKSVIKLYSSISLILENSKTSDFLGTEYIVLALLATNKKDITTNLICATNLLARFYECMNKFDLMRVTPNINKHIFALKKYYGLGLANIKNTILSNNTNKDMHKQTYTLNSYLPYLKVMFNNCKTNFIYSKLDFTSRELELALALSSSLSSKSNILRFARDFGYFENLL